MSQIQHYEEKAPKLDNWVMLFFLALVWGSSYILIKKGLEVFAPVQVATLRICISALAFLPLFISRFKNIKREQLKYLLIVGFAGSGIPAFCFAFAQTEISSSIAGVLSSLTPLFTLVLGILFFKRPTIWLKILGVIIGLGGAIFLIIFGKSAGIEGNLWYGLLVVFGCLMYATSVNTVGSYLQDLDSKTISAVSFFMIGIPGFLYMGFSGIPQVLTNVEGAWTALGYITLLALFGTVLASVLFFKLVQDTSPIFASMVSYLIPLIALVWGQIDGESITLFHFAGMVLILIGVYISRK